MAYQEAFSVLAERYPDLAKQVQSLEKFSWKPIQRGPKGGLDLTNGSYFLHEADNIEASIRYWITQIPLKENDGLIIYGLGLGDIWDTIKEWLHSKPYRRLIFIEDDIEIVHHFLSRDRAVALLSDPQVQLISIPSTQADLRDFFWKFSRKMLFFRVHFTALPSYRTQKTKKFEGYKTSYEFIRYGFHALYGEYFNLSRDFFTNFWANLPQLASSYLMSALEGQFKDLPAIICGAGPSLEKNIHLLKELSDKALIISGGTAVNILNANGINPHLIVGVDPFTTSYYRILSYTSYETPLVYKLRMLNEGISTLSSPLVFFNGGALYDAEKEMEKDFNLPHLNMNIGVNVINASLAFAHALGCDPLITVGVDLAYSEGGSYGPGLKKHAMTFEKLKSKNAGEEVIIKNDIYGKPVKTLWKWVNESLWYSEFQTLHPEATVINATEGGIGFHKVSNIPLKEVADTVLTSSYDISGKLHAHLQKAPMPEAVTVERLELWTQEMLESLERSLEIMGELERDNPSIITRYDYVSFLDDNEPLAQKIDQLKEEKGWKKLLCEFDKLYLDYLKSVEFTEEEREADEHPVLRMYGGRLGYLKRVAEFNVSLIKRFGKKKVALENSPSITCERQEVGESNFYDESGCLLASTSYQEGKRHGPAKYWYAKGGLFADLYFSQGRFEGTQKYFYPDGSRKSLIPYSEGLLEGEVLLFWPNGQRKRSSHFKRNKRHGKDELWNEQGRLLIEADYEEDHPVGYARTWSDGGLILKEITYDKEGHVNSFREWDENGLLIANPELKGEDYLDFVSRNTDALTTSLENVFSQLKGSIIVLQGDKASFAELDSLRGELDRLRGLGLELGDISKHHDIEESERNPKLEKSVKSDLALLTEKMKNLIYDMERQVQTLRKNIGKNE